MAFIGDLDTVKEARNWAVNRHRQWKIRCQTNDLIASGTWSTIWDDLSHEFTDPLVENLYLEALEDKAASAASIMPQVRVAPTAGTRLDRAERHAQLKRRVFVTYNQRSRVDRLVYQWYLDWMMQGAAYSFPWCNFYETPIAPFFVRVDPRHVFPLAHDTRGEMSAGFISKVRRVADIKREWGDHPGLRELLEMKRTARSEEDAVTLEEIWVFDNTQWSVALYDDSAAPADRSAWRYITPTRTPSDTQRAVWLAAPTVHNLGRCPLIENKRDTPDGEYRGALDVMHPPLRVAQNLMARILEDVNLSVWSPTVATGIDNIDEYGPGAILTDDGSGTAKIEYPRPPVNFEAHQIVSGSLDASRRVGKYPEQRSGDPGGSVVSGKGVNAVMGAFNVEQAHAQRDMEQFLAATLSVTAALDEQYGAGRKQIDGFDLGEAFDETYDPTVLFRGDYRVTVSYGGSLGMDNTNFLITLSTMYNLEALSIRTLMEKSGIVENPLKEETERAIDNVIKGLMGLMFQQAQEGGNLDPLIRFVDKIDGDKKTIRSAALEVVREMMAPTPSAGQGPGGPGGGGALDPVLMARSLASGGVPGQAEGQPGGNSQLRAVLPRGISRALSEVAPGGTAA